MQDSLGDRIKRYEDVTRYSLVSKTPVIIRLDGKAFHSYAAKAKKPFDMDLVNSMAHAARCVAEQMQGFKLAYIQSDEASFLISDYDEIETQGWFDYNMRKIETVAASIMTAHFNNQISKTSFYNKESFAYFDGRAFNMPKEDVPNYFLWRQKDWIRNSLSMYARNFFSHKQLNKKSCSDVHEMLHSIGKNWANDLLPVVKNGTFIVRTEKGNAERDDIVVKYDTLSAILKDLKVL